MAYAIASMFLDPAGLLGTDTGGKEATVVAMSEAGSWYPDIGYWAEDVDPEGRLHAYFGTRRTEHGWVNVTTLPMILASRPLYEIGGARALYVVPALGSVLAALAAGALSKRFGAERPHLATVVTAVASPAAIYALDFWEHSLGLALILWGTVFTVDLVQDAPVAQETRAVNLRSPVLAGLLAGFSYGAAATMRQEALIYGFVAGLAAVGWGVKSLRNLRVLPSVAMAAGALVMLAANAWLDNTFVGSASRLDRSTGVLVSGGGTTSLSRKFTDAALSTALPINTFSMLSLLMGVLVMTAMVWITLAVLRGQKDLLRPMTLVGLSILLIFLRVVALGPGFISGLFAASPLAAAGLAAAWHFRRLLPLALALAPLPLVYWFQFPGAAQAQWGGRYILASGGILLAFACASIGPAAPKLLRGFVVANAALTLLGFVFLVTRGSTFAEGSRWLADRPDEVLVYSDSFLAREAGSLGLDKRWLAAESDEEEVFLLDVLDRAEITEFGWVYFADAGDPPDLAGFTQTTTEDAPHGLGLRVRLTTYVAEAGR